MKGNRRARERARYASLRCGILLWLLALSSVAEAQALPAAKRPAPVAQTSTLHTSDLSTLARAPTTNAVMAAANTCTRETGVNIQDPNTGWTWTTRYRCGNRQGAPMYGDANDATQTAIMDTTNSWFVCWRRGEMHAGGNDIWYYSKGDREVAPFGRRKRWGYMPAVHVWTNPDPYPGISQCPVGETPPTRTDGLDKPIYFIHGYDIEGRGLDAKGSYWEDALADYASDGDPARFSGVLGKPWTWCYYSNDINCDLLSIGGRDKAIRELGRELAEEIYDHFSRFGDSVDVVAHSMGGLIIKAALVGVARGESDFPPYLYVEDVTTLATPHRGVPAAQLSHFGPTTRQVSDMAAGSEFFSWLFDDPQSAQLTAWTLVGFDDDLLVPAWSAVPRGDRNSPAAHKIIYPKGQFLSDGLLPRLESHMLPLWRTDGEYTIEYCDHYDACNMADRNTFHAIRGSYDAVKISRYASYWWWTW